MVSELSAVPPLRNRPEDIRALAEHFLAKLSVDAEVPAKHLAAGALQSLQKTAWAGDVDLIGLTTGNDTSDEATNLTIVIAHAPPVNAVAITERRLGELGDDRNFGPQMRTGWSQRSARDVHRARGVLH